MGTVGNASASLVELRSRTETRRKSELQQASKDRTEHALMKGAVKRIGSGDNAAGAVTVARAEVSDPALPTEDDEEEEDEEIPEAPRDRRPELGVRLREPVEEASELLLADDDDDEEDALGPAAADDDVKPLAALLPSEGGRGMSRSPLAPPTPLPAAAGLEEAEEESPDPFSSAARLDLLCDDKAAAEEVSADAPLEVLNRAEGDCTGAVLSGVRYRSGCSSRFASGTVVWRK